MAVTSVWSDLHHDLVTDAHGNIRIAYDLDSVITSIDNILRTYQGERVMLPEFASKLRNMVFEPMDDSLRTTVAREVKRVIERWDDRPTVTSVSFHSYPDNSSVEMEVSFRVTGHTDIFKYSTTISGGT